MAGYVATIAALTTGTAGPTAVFSVTTATAATGDILVLSIRTPDTVSAVSDSKGNSYTVIGQGASSTATMAAATITTNLTTSDTITVTSSSTSTVALIAAEYSGLSATPEASGATHAFNTSVSVSLSGLSAPAYGIMVATESASDTLTAEPTNLTWTELEPAGTLIDQFYADVPTGSTDVPGPSTWGFTASAKKTLGLVAAVFPYSAGAPSYAPPAARVACQAVNRSAVF